MSVTSLSKFKEPDLVYIFKLLVLCNDIKCLKQGKKQQSIGRQTQTDFTVINTKILQK